MNDIECGKCNWYMAKGEKSTYGDCHYNPPTVTAEGDSVLPIVSSYEYCSKFKPLYKEE